MSRSVSPPWLAMAVAVAALANGASAQIGIEHQKLLANDGVAGDEFGVAVAVEGDTLVVGADQDDSGAGSVYVFARQADGSWAETQKLTASNPDSGDEFGTSIGLSGDWVAIGARLEDSGGSGAGSVYLFENQGGTYVETQRIQPGDRNGGDFFGIALAIDGDRLVVGASRDDPSGNNSGSAYIFEQSGGTWSEVAKLTASDGEAVDQFGGACAIDGERVVIGTLFDDTETGAAYVYEHQGGGIWAEMQKLTASDKATGDEFGGSCAIDGDLILVSARIENASGTGAGSVYAFEWIGGSWTETDKFQGSDTSGGDQFGYSLALDGRRAVIGAHRADPSSIANAGKVYVFERRADGTWTQLARIFASDPEDAEFFGFSSAISQNRVALGAVWDNEIGSMAGGAYVAESEFLRSAEGISVSAGGVVDYHISLGIAAAGANYWVLGSASGVTPGIVLHGVDVPLNFDLYLLLTIKKANSPPFGNSRGILDSDGQATMSLSVPGGLDPALVGLEIDHAATTFTSGPTRFTSTSHPARISLQN